jgi:hypothetical protein
MIVRHGQLYAGEPAFLQASDELGPETAGLDLADIDADHLADAGLMHRVGNDDGLGHHTALVTNLDVLGIEPQIRIGAL